MPTLEQTPPHDEKCEAFPHAKESENESFCSMDNASYWNSVDIVGSPLLTKLIGALTIEECNIPALDLDIDMPEVEDILKKDLLGLCKRVDSAEEESNAPTAKPWSTTFSVLQKPSRMFEKRTQHIWQHELYPFPNPSSPSHASKALCSCISVQPKMSEIECKRKLRNLNNMTDAEVIHLVHLMQAESYRLLYSQNMGGAETWLRRVITAKQKVKWYKPQQTLQDCLLVIQCVLQQDRYKEAQQLHKDFHIKVERLLGADHDICIDSRDLMSCILRNLGFLAESVSIRREVLQSRLVTHGTRHPDTIRAMHNLAFYLKPSEKHQKAAQHLMETVVRFKLETIDLTCDNEFTSLNTIQSIALLAGVFNDGGRYDKSENLWNYTQKSLGNTTKIAAVQTFDYHTKRAHGYRLQKRFDESEKILRDLLEQHEKTMPLSLVVEVIGELTGVLMETSRQREAEYWLKREYLLRVKIYGPAHPSTVSCCSMVGKCLWQQRRHHEARRFFGNVIEILASSDDYNESHAACIRWVNGCKLKAEEMVKMEYSMEICSGSDASEEEWRDTDEDDEDDEDINFDQFCDL
jgi:tetratricopeptide (TPR) repeat protein